ncbi:MAG: ribosome maturation factor RimP [Candidatus Omnitrophica bacterium CG_4_9_14_0_2_um_filter_42_8]|nr:MAG: ribosome maturation factor RimP [Candidatus Omnitrophica bacterium CG22_combo_CG10-13_8_21_14_all_43_16]PJC48657.1 MAG: ribosome maturation factor RimP [Candidatus Omnitrophica bacterium CG_4_9_14_0_2_um_filter_42_8]
MKVGAVCPLFLLPMIDKIKEVIEPVIQEEKAELVEIIFRKEGGRQVLKLLVDKDNGIQMADCVSLNEKIGQALDQADIIQESYVIEVDSPGIDRPFKTKRDYERALGRLVRVTLVERIADKKEYIARLEEVSDAGVKIDVKKKGIIEIPFEKIVRAREEIEF